MAEGFGELCQDLEAEALACEVHVLATHGGEKRISGSPGPTSASTPSRPCPKNMKAPSQGGIPRMTAFGACFPPPKTVNVTKVYLFRCDILPEKPHRQVIGLAIKV